MYSLAASKAYLGKCISLHGTQLVNCPINEYLLSIKYFYSYNGSPQRGLCSDGNGGSNIIELLKNEYVT